MLLVIKGSQQLCAVMTSVLILLVPCFEDPLLVVVEQVSTENINVVVIVLVSLPYHKERVELQTMAVM